MNYTQYQRKTADDELSPREIQCLYWAMHDKTVKGTSRVLNISPETVKKHRQTLLKKLECKTMCTAVAYALQRGIVSCQIG